MEEQMIKRKIRKDIEEPLEFHEDNRGTILDIFYKKNIDHVAVINSKPGALRGNHYHKKSTQHMLITKGSLEYWYKDFDSASKAKHIVLQEGDLVTTPPFEIHALKIIEENEFIVFSEGQRGGKDYEADTFRVEESIILKNHD